MEHHSKVKQKNSFVPLKL